VAAIGFLDEAGGSDGDDGLMVCAMEKAKT
jgi:hypothetical protein